MDSENISIGNLQYRVAGWPHRVVARGLDVALIVIGCAVPGEILGVFAGPLALVYLFIGNGLLNGASLGKRVMGLRVVESRHGGPCSVMQDFVRQRYLLSANPVFLALTAYDASKGCFDKPETYVVHAALLTAAEGEGQQEVMREKPAKLDLEGMGEMLKKMREVREKEGVNDE